MITHLDAQIGRILETLQNTGHFQDTLIVFASDNGLAVGRHGLMGKQNLYEHSQRVPLIFAGPGIPVGQSDALVYLFDVFPTVADIFQIPLPDGVEGQSLLPIMRKEKQKVRDAVFGAYREFQRSVRTERYKYITYHVKDEFHEQLFDIQNDPWEMKNLANDPAHRDVKSQLKERLLQLQQQLDDPVLKE